MKQEQYLDEAWRQWDAGEGRLQPTPLVPSLKVAVAAISDIGKTRDNNEDCFGYDLEAGLFLVCDGMGGSAGGEIASQTAVDQILLHYQRLRAAETPVEESLYQAMLLSNRTVWAMAQEHRELAGMGTTMVAACVDQNRVVLGNVGDSRAYLIRGGVCQQVTQDHSYAAEQARAGKLTGADADGVEAGMLPQWITRAIGVQPSVLPDLFTALLEEDDAVLLASDGLTRYAQPEAIAAVIGDSQSPAEACRRLVEIAEQGGAEDNVTCLLMQLIEV